MFGCGFAVIVEGILPESSPRSVVTAYSLSLSLSFCFLFLSVWMAMKVCMNLS